MKITEVKTVEEFREVMGMKPDQLMVNAEGELGTLLAIEDGHAIIGILHEKDPVKVPLTNFCLNATEMAQRLADALGCIVIKVTKKPTDNDDQQSLSE